MPTFTYICYVYYSHSPFNVSTIHANLGGKPFTYIQITNLVFLFSCFYSGTPVRRKREKNIQMIESQVTIIHLARIIISILVSISPHDGMLLGRCSRSGRWSCRFKVVLQVFVQVS